MPKEMTRARVSHRERVRITVSVHAPGGAHYPGRAVVQLRRPGATITLKKPEGLTLYRANVAPGQYSLNVNAGHMVAPSRPVTVESPGKTASAYLGLPSWPFYRLGENLVPFEPHDDLLGVAFDHRTPDPNRTSKHVTILLKELPIELYRLEANTPNSFTSANGAIWLFRLFSPVERASVSAAIRRLLDRPVRIGIPVDLIPGQVKVLDNYFVVRFKDYLTTDEIQALVDGVHGQVLRGFIQAGNARLVAFQRGAYLDHLAIVEAWIRNDLLVYGEPDLLAELVDLAFPLDPPNDPEWVNGNHGNLVRQTVDQAWQRLGAVDSSLTLGSPAVYVATLDTGIRTTPHTISDIGGTLLDGTDQIDTCYNLLDLVPCNDPKHEINNGHGTQMYSIIAAHTNNSLLMSGVAPNTHQIAVYKPDLTSASYADALIWLAGFVTGNPTPGWPEEPIKHAADVINCSHIARGLALSGLMDNTFAHLTTYGRGGKGVIVVYAAGNDQTVITGWHTWAAHPRTVAASNSDPPSGKVERLHASSNYGPEIDLCAQGEAAPSLNHAGLISPVGGTSAAAATVSGAAALVLSMVPDLSWIDIRDLLRESATQIDLLNNDPEGQWVNGFSQWYGYGRLNVGAAVQAAALFDSTAVTLLVRENLADDGTLLPSMGRFWRSPDLWVRQADPLGDPAGDPPYNMDPPHQAALFGLDNWIRVRVKNVGTQPSRESYVRVYLNHFAGTQFVYPTDFVPTPNPGNLSVAAGAGHVSSGRNVARITCARCHSYREHPVASRARPTEQRRRHTVAPVSSRRGLAADRTDAIRPARLRLYTPGATERYDHQRG